MPQMLDNWTRYNNLERTNTNTCVTSNTVNKDSEESNSKKEGEKE